MNLFTEFSIVLAVAAGMAFFMKLLRQPMVIGYIITGILVGPFVFGLISSFETFALFSEIGIAILLFTVGLNINTDTVKNFGKVSILTGVGQVTFTSIAGFLISLLLGFGWLEALYIGVALAFSSTIIILKLISDRGDLETLYAKVAIGFLLVQDFIAIFLLFIIPLASNSDNSLAHIAQLVAMGAIMVFGILLLSKIIMPRMNRWISSSQELLIIFSIAWGVAIATIFKQSGFSLESGALIAGVALANLPSRESVIARLMPLREFFLIMFFVLLGSQLILTNSGIHVVAAITLSILVLIGNPLILLIIMRSLGFRKRTSLFTGFTVAQISEFSLIVVALGLKLGHVSQSVLSLVTIVGIITIFGSTYFILYADAIYKFLEPYLGIFEKKNAKEIKLAQKKYKVILFGCNRIGYDFLLRLKKEFGSKLLAVDVNPDMVDRVKKLKIKTVLGDAGDINFIESLDFSTVEMVVSTIPDPYVNSIIQKVVKSVNKKTMIFLTAQKVEDAIYHYKKGADYIVLPHLLGGKYASDLLSKSHKKRSSLMKLRTKHIEYLTKRKKSDFDKNYPHKHSYL